jgi:hypothetical protein
VLPEHFSEDWLNAFYDARPELGDDYRSVPSRRVPTRCETCGADCGLHLLCGGEEGGEKVQTEGNEVLRMEKDGWGASLVEGQRGKKSLL